MAFGSYFGFGSSSGGGGNQLNFGYYLLSGSFVQVPFTTSIQELSLSTINSYGNFNILTLPPDLSYWVNATSINLSGNVFQTWSDFSSLTLLTTFNASYQQNIGGLFYTTNLNGLVLPTSIQYVEIQGCYQLNDYIDFFGQGLFSISNIFMGDNNMNQATINNQIQSIYDCVTSPSYIGTPTSIDLSAGANASPSGNAVNQIADLVNNYGWAITTN